MPRRVDSVAGTDDDDEDDEEGKCGSSSSSRRLASNDTSITDGDYDGEGDGDSSNGDAVPLVIGIDHQQQQQQKQQHHHPSLLLRLRRPSGAVAKRQQRFRRRCLWWSCALAMVLMVLTGIYFLWTRIMTKTTTTTDAEEKGAAEPPSVTTQTTHLDDQDDSSTTTSAEKSPDPSSSHQQPNNNNKFVPYDHDASLIPPLREYGSSSSSSPSYSVNDMRLRFDQAKSRLMQRLEQEYGVEMLQHGLLQLDVQKQHQGDNSTKNGNVALRAADASSSSKNNNKSTSSATTNTSWERMKGKLILKLLQVQLRVEHLKQEGKNEDRANNNMVPFVWATGGHSAAAAHGNLYNESYTAVLERTVQDAFAQTGLWMQARNYAMGGTASGPEVALCEGAIFGSDIDVLSWDFGMTDGRNMALLELYFRQASLLPNRPAGVGIEVAGGGAAERMQVLQHLGDSGLTVLYLDDRFKTAAIQALPDCNELTPEEVNALPPYVRNFKCGVSVEKGGDCEDAKWTNVTGICPAKPKFRTGWHPGWKWHTLIGNLIGLSLLELLDQALTDLERLDTTSLQARYDELRTREEADYARFHQSSLLQNYADVIDESNTVDDLNLNLLFRGRGICHTAFLPAETRYKGILTMNSTAVGFQNYAHGISREQADQESNDDSEFLRLVYDSSDRQDCGLLEVDHKDYYYLSEREGWKKLMVPNQAELDTYSISGEPSKGLIALALKPCSWGRCKPEDVREGGLTSGDFEIEVNNVPVTNLTNVYGVQFLSNERGHVFRLNDSGQYEIRIRVIAPGKYLRLTSFIFF